MTVPAIDAFRPQAPVTSAEWGDLKRFIGPAAAQFARRWNNVRGRWKLGWNWGAFLLGEFWLIYRRMFFAVILFMLLQSSLMVAAIEAGAGPFGVLSIFCGMRLWLAMEGDGYYFAHSLVIIRRIREAPLDEDQKEMVLRGLGGTSLIAAIGMIMIFIMMVAEITRTLQPPSM